MISFTLMTGSGESADPLPDVNQRIRPVLSGDRVTWTPADGRVASHKSNGFEVKYRDPGKGFKTALELAGHDVELYISDARIVFIARDVPRETTFAGWIGGVLTGGFSSSVKDLGRAIGGGLGLREKFHLVAQMDYSSLAMVRYYQTRMFGTRSLLDVGVLTGDPAPRVLEIIQTSLGRKDDIASIASDIVTRAKRARARNEFGLSSDDELRQLAARSFEPNNDAFFANIEVSAINLEKLHQLTGTAPAAERSALS